ncbi:MAG: Zn-ribbon domain-containing OB-fold protein [Ilumatobacteraceae bacterium]|jgi:uncharacterized OB-fold protein|nr:Zn-ribbon domain-containing OB-fold protein [Acidimicrobiaceae bacterium]MBK9971543.1 Zn-ribbon domain-containing OB-fold protein [Acidimicrobiaceae bacterium]MBP8208836.1 Zn-ribbon domain-containing OB-fold protein [Ilumatobacteraceae bacterium]MBP9051234.1 Zn-ribbon domain-containing OB-fold protein [Ilumatobacteraceae bacterium]
MPRIEPTPTPLSQPFWDATRDRRLLAQRCAMCDRYVWYPREHCPGCLRSELEWVELSGNGTIYTFNVMRKPGNPMMADAVPYVLALVDLDEGVRMTTNIVHVSPEEVRCGQRVSVDWSIQLDDGRCLPTFAPTVR